MIDLKGLFSIWALCGWTTAALADQDDDPRPEQDFLFLLEEGYVQDRNEWQVELAVNRERNGKTDWRTDLGVEYGITGRVQAELSIPYRNLETPAGSRRSDIGDIELGLTFAALRETDISPQLALSIETSAPTGDADGGTGAGAWSYGFGIAASKNVSEHLFLHVNAAHERLNNGFGDDETFDGREWFLGAGGVVEVTRALAVAVEYTFEHERENSNAETGTEQSSLFSIGLIYQPFDEVAVGLAGVLGLNDQAPDNSIIFRTQVEW